MTMMRLQQCYSLQLKLTFNFAIALQTMNAWKFPGGLSDPGEDIGECPAQWSKKKTKNKKTTNTAHVAITFSFSML